MILLSFNYLSWTASTTEDMLAIVGNLFSDLTPVVVPIVAIGVALMVFEAIVWAVKKH